MAEGTLVLLGAAASTSGPSFEVQGWLAWIIIAGAVALALAAIWKVVVPFARACHRVISAIDVVFDIAKEFRPNSGTTLHDRLVNIDRGLAANTKALHRNYRKLGELWRYSHRSHHDLVNALVHVGPGVDVIVELAKKLGPGPREIHDPSEREEER